MLNHATPLKLILNHWFTSTARPSSVIFFHNIYLSVYFNMCYSLYDFREDVVKVWQKGSLAVDGEIKLKAPTLPLEHFFFFLINCLLSHVSLFDGVHSIDSPCPGRGTFLAQPWITVCSWRSCWSRNPSRREGPHPPTSKCASLSWPNPSWFTTSIATGYVSPVLSQSNGRKDEVCLRGGRMLMEGRMLYVKFC